jgi:TM2 domain-containing membrane protein YozV
MTKLFTAFLAMLLLTLGSQATVISPGANDPKPVNAPMTFEQFVKMTPQQIEEVTGKKLNVVQKVAFKKAQKTMVKKGAAAAGKSQLVALLLCFFVGVLGVHRFYLGYTWQGIVQLLTFGGLGVWTLIDFIRIIIGDLKPKDGEYATTLD